MKLDNIKESVAGYKSSTATHHNQQMDKAVAMIEALLPIADAAQKLTQVRHGDWHQYYDNEISDYRCVVCESLHHEHYDDCPAGMIEKALSALQQPGHYNE